MEGLLQFNENDQGTNVFDLRELGRLQKNKFEEVRIWRNLRISQPRRLKNSSNEDRNRNIVWDEIDWAQWVDWIKKNKAKIEL